jgi:hypothetical protein
MIRAHKAMQSLKLDVANTHHATDIARALRSNTRLIELVLGGQVGSPLSVSFCFDAFITKLN